MTTSDTNLSQLVINELTKAQYEALTPVANQLYLTPDTTDADIATAVGTHNTSATAHSGSTLPISITGNASWLTDMNSQPQNATATEVSGDVIIMLARQQMLYWIKPVGNVTSLTFAITNANIEDSAPFNHAYTFELMIDMTSAVYTITLPSIHWEGNSVPTLNGQYLYMLVFRRSRNVWYGSLQGWWA